MQYFVEGMSHAVNSINDKSISDSEMITSLVANIDKTIASVKEEIQTFCDALDYVEAKYTKNDKISEVASIFPFLYLSYVDIMILHKQYLLANDSLEKNLVCRTAAQHMYEFLEDSSRVLGKQMNLATNSLNDDKVNLELRELRKFFNNLKTRLHNNLKKIRHNVSGHKDRNVRDQLKIINSIAIIDFQENFILFTLFFISLRQFRVAVSNAIDKKG